MNDNKRWMDERAATVQCRAVALGVKILKDMKTEAGRKMARERLERALSRLNYRGEIV